jgi:hypothetical protein
MLPGVSHLPHTHDLTRNAFSKGEPEHGIDFADALDGLLTSVDPSTVAAVIVEPVAGAGGVLPPPLPPSMSIRRKVSSKTSRALPGNGKPPFMASGAPAAWFAIFATSACLGP